MEIRPIERDDVHRGYLETIAALSPATTTTEDIAGNIDWRSRTMHSTTYTFVATVDRKIVGTYTIVLEQKLNRDSYRGLSASLENVAVHPEYQGRGIGAALVKHAVKVAKDYGCYKVVLHCDHSRAGFYQQAGFYTNGVSMRLDID